MAEADESSTEEKGRYTSGGSGLARQVSTVRGGLNEQSKGDRTNYWRYRMYEVGKCFVFTTSKCTSWRNQRYVTNRSLEPRIPNAAQLPWISRTLQPFFHSIDCWNYKPVTNTSLHAMTVETQKSICDLSAIDISSDGNSISQNRLTATAGIVNHNHDQRTALYFRSY